MAEVIPVRMYPATVEQVEKLQKIVHAPSRSDAIRRAVEISTVLVSAIQDGDIVIIQGKDGKQRQILITGLNK